MADEFTDKLNSILGNPEAMGQILTLAQSLSGGAPASPKSEGPAGEAAPAPPDSSGAEGPASAPDLSGLLSALQSGQDGQTPRSALGDIDPKLLQMGARLLSEFNQKDDRRTALLTALRPFVREERYAKLDRAIQIARLSRVIRAAFRFFQEEGQGNHV